MNTLLLATFPAEHARHGGQHRIANIKETYERLGVSVQNVGIQGSPSYPASAGYVSYPEKLICSYEKTFLMEDYIIGQLVIKNRDLQSSLRKKIRVQPDIIHVEHPWLVDFANRYRSECKCKLLVYGSANVESECRYSMLRHYFDENSSRSRAELIRRNEIEAARMADIVFAVSKQDYDWYSQYVPSTKIILARNGVNKRKRTLAGKTEFEALQISRKFCMVCGSGYPFNAMGLIKCFSQGFGCLSPDQNLVIVGGMCNSLVDSTEFNEIAGLKRRCIFVPSASEDLLAECLFRAHCVLLPIYEGGGSNLKTAEALLSGKYIIGTSKSFVGYEEYLNCKGIWIEDDPISFVKRIRQVMNLVPLQLDEKEMARREELLWSKVLMQPISRCISLAEGINK